MFNQQDDAKHTNQQAFASPIANPFAATPLFRSVSSPFDEITTRSVGVARPFSSGHGISSSALLGGGDLSMPGLSCSSSSSSLSASASASSSPIGLVSPQLQQHQRARQQDIYLEQVQRISAFLAPENMPEFIERSSFETSVFPEAVLSELIQVFSKQNSQIDFQFHPRRHELVCMVYRDCTAIKVHVRVFAKSEDSFLVEFQRRSGDVMSFWGFYNETLEQIQSPKKRTLERSHNSYKCPHTNNQSVQLDQVCIQTLVIMATSVAIDVARQGLLALATLTQSPSEHNTTQLSKYPNLVEQLVTSLGSADSDVTRLTATIICNLMSCPTFVACIDQSFVHTMAQCRDTCQCLETKRQLTSTLSKVDATTTTTTTTEDALRRMYSK